MEIRSTGQGYFINKNTNPEAPSQMPKAESQDVSSTAKNNTDTPPQNSTFSAQDCCVPLKNIGRTQQAILIRDLLSLPKEIRELLAFIMYQEITPEIVKGMLDEKEKSIPLLEVQKLLETGSKDAIRRLLMLMQPSGNGLQNADQIKDIVNLL